MSFELEGKAGMSAKRGLSGALKLEASPSSRV